MWGLVQAVVQSVVVDLALIIEAKEAQQLPERLLGAARPVDWGPAAGTPLDLPWRSTKEELDT